MDQARPEVYLLVVGGAQAEVRCRRAGGEESVSAWHDKGASWPHTVLR
jgi:hypothetical protein